MTMHVRMRTFDIDVDYDVCVCIHVHVHVWLYGDDYDDDAVLVDCIGTRGTPFEAV